MIRLALVYIKMMACHYLKKVALTEKNKEKHTKDL